jgi:cytochrome c oxidase subunit III
MSDTAAQVANHHEHNPGLQHHFYEMEQQADSVKIGMWAFLVTELLLFGGLFVGYGVMNARFPEAFSSAHHHLDKTMGALNTIVLLVSSFTMVMAVAAARASKTKQLVRYLVVTLALAGVFLVVKYFEYSHKIHEGLLPGKFYSYTGPHEPFEQVFFGFYFLMTGVHGIHIVLGMIMMTWLLIRARRGEFSSAYNTPVDMGGLYWHLVDIIWIYLFPLMYLIS